MISWEKRCNNSDGFRNVRAQQKSDTFSALDERSIPEVPEVAPAIRKRSSTSHFFSSKQNHRVIYCLRSTRSFFFHSMACYTFVKFQLWLCPSCLFLMFWFPVSVKLLFLLKENKGPANVVCNFHTRKWDFNRF